MASLLKAARGRLPSRMDSWTIVRPHICVGEIVLSSLNLDPSRSSGQFVNKVRADDVAITASKISQGELAPFHMRLQTHPS